MAQSFYLREQAERCRRLARDSIDPDLRGSLLRLAGEYAARASAGQRGGDTVVWQAGGSEPGQGAA
jgi:hypothetical protein